MRLLHVSDLHLGRELHGISRREEQERLVDELAELAGREAVDAVLVAGDVFDGSNPPAWAEDAFFGLLDRLNDGGRRAVVVIAGNHDHPVRLAAAAPLARRQGIVLLGTMEDEAVAHAGPGAGVTPLGPGAFVLTSADGARRCGIAALPFVAEAALVKRPPRVRVLPTERDDKALYGEALAALLHERFELLSEDLPRVAVAHLWVQGAENSASERVYRTGGLADIPAEALPPADYTALGHLHRPQQVSAPHPVVYAGSPIAYSLSERGQTKRAVLVELSPGRPAQWRDLPLGSGRPVELWEHASVAEVEARARAIVGRPPIVKLVLDVGAALTREDLDRLQALAPVTFIGVETTACAALLDGEAPNLPGDDATDEELLRAFFARQLGEVDDALLAEALRLLAPEPHETRAVEAA